VPACKSVDVEFMFDDPFMLFFVRQNEYKFVSFFDGGWIDGNQIPVLQAIGDSVSPHDVFFTYVIIRIFSCQGKHLFKMDKIIGLVYFMKVA
jgi:hypothetical protein